MKRGEVWSLPDGRNVLVISLNGLEQRYGAVLTIVLHPAGRYPDTAMSVVVRSPIEATAVAVNILQLRISRFENGTLLGSVGNEAMAAIDAALRAVLDL